MLPLVRSIVVEVVALSDSLNHQNEQLRGIDRLAEHPSPEAYEEELEDVRQSIQRDHERLKTCIDELASLGIRLHEPIDGGVDFPGELGGQRVVWCWRPQESVVSHWHAPEADASTRHPVSSVN